MVEEKQQYPFIAPCKKLSIGAPIDWLKAGLSNVSKAPAASLSYGLLMSLMVMLVLVMVWQYGGVWLVMSLLCGFVFLAPMACIGIYAISAQLERNQPVSLIRSIRAFLKRYLGTELVFALVLLILFLVWARAGSMVSIFIPNNPDADLASMSGYVLGLGAVSLIFLSLTFSISVFSLPMIMHRDVDAVTAVVTSINAVLRNKTVMVFWGLIIALMMVIGIVSGGILLVVFLPAIGHAVWYGYQDTIDASAFPRHEEGITSTPVNKNGGEL